MAHASAWVGTLRVLLTPTGGKPAADGRPRGKGDVRSVKIPHGTRYLLITCAEPTDGQSRGVAQACRLLAKADGVHHLAWAGGRPLQLGRRRTLRWVVVSGHGAEGEARISDGRGRHLYSRDLPLPRGIDLYLLACYQGQETIRQKWAAKTKATVHGCEGETESALSTLFLLALLEHGPESAAHWFARWREANDRLRPHFPEMRRLYEERGKDFAAALDAIGAVVDLGPLHDILAVAKRYAPILSGLG